MSEAVVEAEALPLPEVLTFSQGRDMLADDLKAVGGFFADAEVNVREGDTDAMLKLIDQMSVWRDMLLLRFQDRMERIDAGRVKKKIAEKNGMGK